MSVMRRKNAGDENSDRSGLRLQANRSTNSPDICDYIDAELAQAESIAHDAEFNLREIVPLSTSSTGVERRASPRTYTTYRLVRIASEADEGFARCRNISDEGARLLVTMPLRSGDRVSLAFSALGEITGRVIWMRDGECGILFDHPVDSAALLRSFTFEGRRRQPPTLSLRAELPATIRFEGHSVASIASEISLRDMKLTHAGEFMPGMHVTVLLNDGEERRAVVWNTNAGSASVSLLEPFDIKDMGSMALLRDHGARA